MRLLLIPPLLCALVIAGCDRKRPSSGAPATGSGTATAATAALPTGNGPYDVMARTYAPFTSDDDHTGFPMKVRNLSTSPYRFWRGSKELFYLWCKTNADDWLKDDGAYLRIHGDLHPGNLGLYHSQGKFGQHVAFGAVDFDDTARLPFQLELLEGVITFDLLARHRHIKLGRAQVEELIDVMIEAYRASLASDQSPTTMLEEDVWVGKMLKKARKREYSTELDKYVHNDQFVSMIADDSGKIKEVLRPLKGRGGFAEAIEDALTHTPDGKDLFKEADVRKKAVEDIARRTQLESAGSEGLHKYLVLLANKKSPEKRLILYLKQQIPTSAERVGLIPNDPRPAGQRSSEDMHDLSNPPAYFNSWCTWNDGSYRLSIKEPWSDTMDAADVNTFTDMKHMAKIWGTVAGSVHRQGKETVDRVTARLTPALSGQLRDRAAAYAGKVVEDFRQFASDPRTRDATAKAEAALKELEGKSR